MVSDFVGANTIGIDCAESTIEVSFSWLPDEFEVGETIELPIALLINFDAYCSYKLTATFV